jgi:trehalose 6-phosphate synthase
MARLVIIANRVPALKERRSGGLAVALEEAIKAETLWLGWSGQIRDKEQKQPDFQSIGPLTIATLHLSTEEHTRYYTGFANTCMFPLLCYRTDLMIYSREDFRAYLAVCERFAAALIPLLKPDDLIWVHDNHLLSIGRILREAGVRNRMGYYSHIPFPPQGLFEVLPCAKDIVTDILTYDVVGFQTQLDRNNFVGTALHFSNAKIMAINHLSFNDRSISALAQPVGIDCHSFAAAARKSANGEMAKQLKGSLDGRKLIIGAERLDYSKGLPLRLAAFASFLSENPQFRKKVSLLEIAARTRETVEEYQRLKRALDQQVGEINGLHADFDWVPIRYMTRSVARNILAGLFRSSAIGLVTPLRDGFNLVAAEFIAAQDEADPGVLVLSRFAGAAETLHDALIVNPYDVIDVAGAIRQALVMPLDERQERWRKSLDVLKRDSAAAWCSKFTKAIAGLQIDQSSAGENSEATIPDF